MMCTDNLETAALIRPINREDTTILLKGTNTNLPIQRDVIVSTLTATRNSTDAKRDFEVDGKTKDVLDDVVPVGKGVAAKRDYGVNETGSMANCTFDTDEIRLTTDDDDDDDHPDAGHLTIYCHNIRYRAPVESFQKIKSVIIIGILSDASNRLGPSRRTSTRESLNITTLHNPQILEMT